jgi:adenosylmethionine-8-amino-7-oxononanoate aminotransferase
VNTLWHPWNPPTAQRDRTVIDHGLGYTVTDARGRTYIDAMSGALNAHCGHANTELVAAAAEQLGRLAHVDLGVAAHQPAVALAERLGGLLPAGTGWHTVFVNSGSEATELAVKLAHDYWRNLGRPRTHIMSLADGYHGGTLLARSLTALPGNTADVPVGFPITRITLPTNAQRLRTGSPEPLLERFADAIRHEPAAAVIVEPLLNVGGGIVLPDGFLTGLRELCDATGTLLILDEVFCGLGHTGRMFGFEHAGVVPDIVTCSKGLGAGYIPIAAVTAASKIYDSYVDDVLRYGHTTGGHAVACAVGLAVLDILAEQRLPENAAARGAELLTALRPLAALPGVRDVRGLGLVVTVEFADETTAERAATLALDAGVILRRQRRHLMAIPPLVIDERGTAELADRMLTAIRPVITARSAA